MNYKKYHLTISETCLVTIKSIGVSALVAILFYRSFWAFTLFPIFFYIFLMRTKEKKRMERIQQIQEQFLSGMRVLNGAIQAGLSMENAWREVQKDLRIMYGENADFYKEITEIINQISVNVTIEKMLLDFAYRTGIEDIISFAEILEYGKRSGGNWRKIIESTVYRMTEKQEAHKEIMVLIAAKKMEQQVMNVIPLGILGFMQLSSWDYMKVLFHNPLGAICMSGCLVAYGVAIILSEKIMQIEV